MAKRALLVGCNYPGTQCELQGCANDVRRMRRTLVERFGFDEDDILMMLDTDPSTPRPTGANIRSSLRKLIASVEPGDVLVFHYSGHGTQVPPESGAPGETDTEEAIVPTDMNLLTDNDFRELVNQIPPGVTFTFLSDSCHSGGMIGNEKEQIGGGGSTGGSSAQQAFLGGDGGGGMGGGLIGLISQGLHTYAGQRGVQSQTRDYDFSSGGRIQEGALYRDDQGYREPQRLYQQEGLGEDAYEGEGRRRQGNYEYEGEGRGYVDEGYGGGRPQDEFYADRRGYGEEGYGRRGQYEQEGFGEEGYGVEGRRRQEEFYEGRRGHGEGRGQRLYEQEGYGEEGYGEGRRYRRNDEYGREGRGGYVNEGYGGRGQQEEFYDSRRGYGGRGRTEGDYEGEGQRVYSEQVYGGRPTRGQGQVYYEAEGGVGYNAGEGYRGEAYGNVNSGRRYERTAEDSYGGYGSAAPASGFSQSHGQYGQGESAYGSAHPRHVVSKNIPVDLLTQILSQRTGQNVQVGNIRTTIFDMFGDQASPSVKMFVNLALSQLQQGKGQSGWLGTISSLASQFLQAKLDGQGPDDAANYMAPAQHAHFPRPKTRVASDVSILVSGCQADETSADANPTHNPANSYGAFSNAVQTVLGQNPSSMTNRELVLAVRHLLSQQGFKQHPCLYCSDENVDFPFIC